MTDQARLRPASLPALTNLQPTSHAPSHLPQFIQNQLRICLADGQVRTAFLLELEQGFETLGLDLADAVLLANRVVMTMGLRLPLAEIEHRLRHTFSATMVERSGDIHLHDVVEMAMSARAGRIFSALQTVLEPLRQKRILDLSIAPLDLAVLIHATLAAEVTCAPAGPFPAPEDRKISGAAQDLRLPFGNGSHDAVLMVDSLRHAGHRPQCLREIARILPAGGKLLVLEKTVGSDCVFDTTRERRLVFLSDFFMRNLLHAQASLPLPDSAGTQEEWLLHFRRNHFQISTVRHIGLDAPLSQTRHTLFILTRPPL